MKDIGRFEELNPGGGMLIEWAPVAAVKTWVAQTAGAYQAAIEFHTGWRWYKLYAKPETIGVSELEKKDNAGIYYDTSIGGFVPGNSGTYRDLWEWAAERKFVVRVKEHQGSWTLYGKPWEGLSMVRKYDSDKAMAGERGFSIAFEGETTSMGAIYNF